MTRRLVLWLTGATILFWIAAVAFGAAIMREESNELFDSALEETAERLLPLVVSDYFQREQNAGPGQISGSSGGAEYLIYQLRDATGAVVLRSHDAPAEPFAAPLDQGFSDTATHKIFTVPAVSNTLFLQVGDPFAERREAIVEGASSLALPLIVLAPLSMLVIWLVVRRALAPIGSLRNEIGARDGGNLAPIEAAGLPPELQTIAGSVDRLLERLRTALDAEREFAANSAHELRTPIAGALAQTQRLIAELPEGAARTRARGIEAALAGLAHLGEKLLQLSRAEAGIGLSDRPADLVPVVSLLVEEFGRKSVRGGRLALTIDAPDGMMRKIDVDAFAIALRNLIENALLHGAQDAPVTVSVGRDGSIRVVNGGPAVAPQELEQLTTRFRRGATAARGAGLGLAIAATLVRRMGGVLELNSPATGRKDGFEATMRFD